jgi:hypothetical protein
MSIVTVDGIGTGVAPEGLVLIPRSPRGADFVTVMINPAVNDYQEHVPAPPGIEIHELMVAGDTDETVTIEARVGQSNSVHMPNGDFDVMLLKVNTFPKTPSGDFVMPGYEFLVEKTSPGSAPRAD